MNASARIDTLQIGYPGITAEVSLNGKHVYEPNFNCGAISSALLVLDSIGDISHKTLIQNMIIDAFEEVRKQHSQLIFITDYKATQNEIFRGILNSIFGEKNYKLIGTKMLEGTKNKVSGIPIRDSQIDDEAALVSTIKDMPEAIVLSSIPYTDPNIKNVLGQLENIKGSKAVSSLRLIDVNSSRESHLEVAGEEIGHIGIVNDADSLRKLAGEEISPMVLKILRGSAGGSGIDFIRNKGQLDFFLNSADGFPYVVNNLIEPKFLEINGERFPFHIRPFFSGNGEYLGCSLKISETGISEEFGASKKGFVSSNKGLNTSAGLSKSILIDKEGNPVVGFVDKNSGPLDPLQIVEYLSQFQLEGKRVTPEIISQLSLLSGGIIRTIQQRTNRLLGFNVR